MRVVLLILLSFLLLGCTVQFNAGPREETQASQGTASDQAAVRAAATEVLVQLDAEAWDKAWGSAASSLRQTTSLAGFTAGIRASRAVFGSPTSRSITGYTFPESVEGAPPGQYGIVFYATDFSKSQGVEEQVVLRREEGQWRLAGYWAEKSKQVKVL